MENILDNLLTGQFYANIRDESIKAFKKDTDFKKTKKVTSGQVIKLYGGASSPYTEGGSPQRIAEVILIGEKVSTYVLINTNEPLAVNDLVFLEYWGSLTNAVIFMKNKSKGSIMVGGNEIQI